MKKNIRFRYLWITACFLLLLLALASCSFFPPFENGSNVSDEDSAATDPGQSSCRHEYQFHGYVGDYSCTEGGTQRLICKMCRGVKEEPVEPREHTPEVKNISATCTTSGYEGAKQCSACKKWLDQGTAIGTTGHTYKSGICTSCGLPESGGAVGEGLALYHSTYGYDYLGTMPNGRAYQALYQEIDQAVAPFHSDPTQTLTGDFLCTLAFAEKGLTPNEALAIWKTYRDDHPLYYWLSNHVRYNTKELYVIVDMDYADADIRLQQNREIYAAIETYQSGLWSEGSDYNKAVYLHNEILKAIDYAYDQNGNPQDANWAHSIVGVFSGQGAVCEGFAKAYQILMNFNGVECMYVTGDGNGEAHAWNLLKLNGKWYGVDVTWDDNNEKHSPYLYFLLSEREFSKMHRADLPTGEGLEFLYATPALAQYNIEPVVLYKNSVRMGEYLSPNEALEAITDANASYTLELLELESSNIHHTPEKFHIYGCSELPQMRSLTIVGKHRIVQTVSGTRLMATALKIDTDLTLSCPVVLKSLFLGADFGTVTVYCNANQLKYGNNSTYYSSVDETVIIRPHQNAA